MLLVLLVIFPFLMILSISLRPGNFAAGSLIPEQIGLEHWKLALGISYTAPDGRLVRPDFPVLLPMAVPILMVVFLLAFIGAIIEYPVASILLHEAKLTLAVACPSPSSSSWRRNG